MSIYSLEELQANTKRAKTMIGPFARLSEKGVGILFRFKGYKNVGKVENSLILIPESPAGSCNPSAVGKVFTI